MSAGAEPFEVLKGDKKGSVWLVHDERFILHKETIIAYIIVPFCSLIEDSFDNTKG
jgi:hypothetical protein